MQTPESPRTPPDRRNPRHPSPTASPTTPPIRAPPKRKHRKLSPSAKKKKAFTIGGFAKSALFGGGFGGHGGEDLRPLREAKGKKVLEEANAEDEEEEWDPFFDSDEDIPEAQIQDVEVISQDPNFNPDLSDSDMSRSPSPFKPYDCSHSLPVSTANLTHPDNVPSANLSLYFHGTIPTRHPFNTFKLQTPDNRVTSVPVAYWKWPSAQEVAEESARKAARLNRRSSEIPFPSTVNMQPTKLTMKNIPIRIQKVPQPPHINWKQREVDVIENAKNAEQQAEQQRRELEQKKKAHAERMKMTKEEALKAVAAGIMIDDKDGFIRVKGTRKRVSAGIDMDLGRVRRKYIWKQGKAPLRGKARAAHEAAVAQEIAQKLELRAARREAGLPVCETDEEEEPDPPTPETRTAQRRRGPAAGTSSKFDKKQKPKTKAKTAVQKPKVGSSDSKSRRKIIESSESESGSESESETESEPEPEPEPETAPKTHAGGRLFSKSGTSRSSDTPRPPPTIVSQSASEFVWSNHGGSYAYSKSVLVSRGDREASSVSPMMHPSEPASKHKAAIRTVSRQRAAAKAHDHIIPTSDGGSEPKTPELLKRKSRRVRKASDQKSSLQKTPNRKTIVDDAFDGIITGNTPIRKYPTRKVSNGRDSDDEASDGKADDIDGSDSDRSGDRGIISVEASENRGAYPIVNRSYAMSDGIRNTLDKVNHSSRPRRSEAAMPALKQHSSAHASSSIDMPIATPPRLTNISVASTSTSASAYGTASSNKDLRKTSYARTATGTNRVADRSNGSTFSTNTPGKYNFIPSRFSHLAPVTLLKRRSSVDNASMQESDHESTLRGVTSKKRKVNDDSDSDG